MKLKQIVLFTLFTAFFACSPDSSDSNSDSNGNNDSDNVLIKKIIFNKGTADEYSDTFNYDGNKLTSVDYGDNSKNVYTYNDDGYIIKDEYFENGTVEAYTTIEYNSDNEIATTIQHFSASTGLDDRSYKCVYTYNNDNTLTEKRYENFENTGYELEYTYTYSFDGKNMTKQSDNDSNYEYTYTYDTKNGVFKNIHGIEVLNILSFYEFGAPIEANTNNTLSTVEEEIDDFINEKYENKYEYTYNSNNYPKTAKGTYTYESNSLGDDSETETIDFVYY